MREKIIKIVSLIILVLLLSGFSQGKGLANLAGGQQAGKVTKPQAGEAPVATTVSVNPLAPTVTNCDILDVYIDVNDVTNLYALDVRLSFNPNVVEVVDFDPLSPVVEVEPIIDPVLKFTAGFTVRNEVNNFSGTIWYAATQTAPTPAANGSGHVARIRMRAKSTASTGFNFTYVKLSDPNGVQIPATPTNGTITATTTVLPTLTITRKNASQVQLSWPVASGVSQYHLYRSTTPYFYAVDPAYQVLAPLTPPATQTYDDSVLGNPSVNYFYTLRAECAGGGGAKSAASNQVGKFEYTLRETSDTDFSWIALPLSVSGITNASSLANHIQNNSNGAVNVLTVGKWNAVSQGIEIYDHVYGFGDFGVSEKFPYRVEINIPSTSSGSVVWAQVGSLPSITYDTYRLYETADTDFNWIMQPLWMTDITSASYLATHIQNNASAPVAVLTVGQWNNTSQSIEIYNHQVGFGDFTTRFGYPYRVEVNVNSGNNVTWP